MPSASASSALVIAAVLVTERFGNRRSGSCGVGTSGIGSSSGSGRASSVGGIGSWFPSTGGSPAGGPAGASAVAAFPTLPALATRALAADAPSLPAPLVLG